MRHTDFRFILDPELGVELLASAGYAADYPWHSHVSTHVLGLVRRGTMTLQKRCNTRETGQTLHAGELFILRPHEAHRLASSRPYALLNLCVDAQTLATPGNTEVIAGRLSALCRDGWLHDPEYAALMAAFERITAAPTRNNVLDELRAFLETHPEENLSLDDLAKRIRLDKFQLIRRFRAHYGLTPHRFQMQNRLRHARRACLSATSLTDLALLAGFYDQSHFIREFRRATGMTPGQYRRAGRILPPSSLTTMAG
jgi:AraC-like DNA-binding protein